MAQTDTAGTILWRYSYDQVGLEYSMSFDFDNDDNTYLTGYTKNTNWYPDGFIAKFDSSGGFVNAKILHHPPYISSRFMDVVYVNDSSIYAIGNVSIDSNIAETRLWIVQLDSNLNMIRSAVLDRYAFPQKIVYDQNSNNLYCLSYGLEPGDTNQKVFIIKTDPLFSGFSCKTIDTVNADAAFGIRMVNSSQLLICGSSFYPRVGWLMLTDTNNFLPMNLYTSTAEIKNSETINIYYLDGSINYLFPRNIHSLSIYSQTGQLISTRKLHEGTGNFECRLPDGIYIISVDMGIKTINKKISIVN